MRQDATFPSLPWSRQPATAVEATFSSAIFLTFFSNFFLDFSKHFHFFLGLFPSMIWCLLTTAVDKPSICQTQPKQLQIQRRQCCLHCSESIHFTTFSTDLKKINFPIPVLRPSGFWPLQWKRPFSNFPQLLNFLPWLFLSLFRCQQSTAMEATHDKALIAAASTALANNVFVKTLMKYLYINIQCIINVYYTLYINILYMYT